MMNAHPKDVTALCPSCGKTTLQHYDATVIVSAPDYSMWEREQFTCHIDSGGCGQTYFRGVRPRPDKTLDDELEVVDLRPDSERDVLKAQIEALFKNRP